MSSRWGEYRWLDAGLLQADSSQSTPYQQEIDSRFRPSLIEVYGIQHSKGLNTEESHQGEAYTWNMGRATEDGQFVLSITDGSNGHFSYVGSGQVIRAIQTDAAGTNKQGTWEAEIKELKENSFTLRWTSIVNDNYYVMYRAYR